MPVDDAISLVSRSFDQYTKTTREKNAAALTAAPVAAAAATATPSSQRSAGPFVPPSSDILYLLNLLADSRQLTIEELDKVINYLRDRRDKQLETDGGEYCLWTSQLHFQLKYEGYFMYKTHVVPFH